MCAALELEDTFSNLQSAMPNARSFEAEVGDWWGNMKQLYVGMPQTGMHAHVKMLHASHVKHAHECDILQISIRNGSALGGCAVSCTGGSDGAVTPGTHLIPI